MGLPSPCSADGPTSWVEIVLVKFRKNLMCFRGKNFESRNVRGQEILLVSFSQISRKYEKYVKSENSSDRHENPYAASASPEDLAASFARFKNKRKAKNMSDD